MPTIDTIIERAKAAAADLEEQGSGGFIYVMFIGEDRETFSIQCDLEDIPQTQEQLQQMLDEGSRPVCLIVLPVREPRFVQLGDDLSLDDRAIIDVFIQGCVGSHPIARRRDPPAEN